MNKVKRNVVAITVLLFVCAAVYLNWSYNNRWGTAETERVSAEDAAMAEADAKYEASIGLENSEDTQSVSSYFASARLTRQQARDDALSLLEKAVDSEHASQETIDSAMSAISAMATDSLTETQIENTLIAKDYADCVVMIGDDGVTVTVPAPVEGLSVDAVARITDTILADTSFTMDQIHIIEIKE